jgi:hypothetical protein
VGCTVATKAAAIDVSLDREQGHITYHTKTATDDGEDTRAATIPKQEEQPEQQLYANSDLARFPWNNTSQELHGLRVRWITVS